MTIPEPISNSTELYLEQDKTSRPAQWRVAQEGILEAMPAGISPLPSGWYVIGWNEQTENPLLFKRDFAADNVVNIPSSVLFTTLEEMALFWGNGPRFAEYGFLHRRGYFLHGPTGNGKTMFVKKIGEAHIKNGGVVFQCENPFHLREGIRVFRMMEPSRRLLVVIEDIDTIIEKYKQDDLLSILDGAQGGNGILFIATSNYPEKIDRRLLNRPRRFDRLIKFENPTAEQRAAYFTAKMGVKSGRRIAELVAATDGCSFSALAEAVILTEVFGKSLDSTQILKDYESRTVSSDVSGIVGFERESKG